MKNRAKNEISHLMLDKKKNSVSARHNFKIGNIFKSETSRMKLILVDKVIYPMDKCPHCQSNMTFHSRMGKYGLYCSNVWESKYFGDPPPQGATASIKMDYCLDCHKEFMIEMYILKRYVSSRKSKKDSKNIDLDHSVNTLVWDPDKRTN